MLKYLFECWIMLPIVISNCIAIHCPRTRHDNECKDYMGQNYWSFKGTCWTAEQACPDKHEYFVRCDDTQPCKPCVPEFWNPHYQLTCTQRRVSPELIPKAQEKEMSTTVSSNHEATTSTVKFTSTVPAATGSTSADDIRPASSTPPYGYEETVDTTPVPLSDENDRNQKRVVDPSIWILVGIVSVVVLLFAIAGVVYGIVFYQIGKYVKAP